MASRKNEWIARKGTWCAVGVSALSLNGCIFFGTEFCDPSIEPDCENSGVGGSAQVGGSGDGDGDGTGGISISSSGGGADEGSGGSITGGRDASGGMSSGGANTGGGGAGGTGGDGTGGLLNTGGAGTGGDDGTGGGPGTGGTGGGSGTGRLLITEVMPGNGSTWVELVNAHGSSIDTADLWISSAATDSPNYSDACSIADLGTMSVDAVGVVRQADVACQLGVTLCARACFDLVAGPGRYIQLFEGEDEGNLTLIKQVLLPSFQPNGDTYHLDDESGGIFDQGNPSPGVYPNP